MSDWFVDFINGNNSNSADSYLQRVKTLSAAALSAVAPGDRVKIMQSASASGIQELNTFIGVGSSPDFVWTRNSQTLTGLTSISVLSNCDAVGVSDNQWNTSNPQVTLSVNSSDYRQGSSCLQAVLSGSYNPAAGPFAEILLNPNVDPGDFKCQAIVFWFKYDNASFSPADCEIVINGTVAVPFPNITYPTGKWICVTIEIPGLHLGSNVETIEFGEGTAATATTILIDNLIMTPYDGLTMNDLVSKGIPGESWYSIRALQANSITLDFNPSQSASQAFLYQGSTQTLPLYYRPPIQPDPLTGTYQSFSADGTASAQITVSGGWNTVDMSTRVAETWIDGSVGTGTGLDISGDHVILENFGVSRFNQGFTSNGINISIANSYFVHNNDTNARFFASYTNRSLDINGSQGAGGYGIYIDSFSFSARNLLNCDSCIFGGFETSASNFFLNINGVMQTRGRGGLRAGLGSGGFLGDIYAENHSSTPIVFQNTKPLTVKSIRTINNGGYGATVSSNSLTVLGISASSNANDAVISLGNVGYQFDHVFQNPSYTESTFVTNLVLEQNTNVFLQNKDGVLNNNFGYTFGANFAVDTSDPNTPGGLDYTVNITSANRSVGYPYIFEVPPGFAVNAGTQVDLTLHIKKSSSAISARFIIPGGQLPGVPDDVYQDVTGSGYNPYTLSFTPTQKGVIRAYVYVWTTTSTTDYVRIADVEIEQA